ncbi:hypothetical protein SAMN05518848_102681 [Paenibacillus sp. PDC88]|nr:hypothetical protein SAMN05518848_102681 [Paenibacillus sp. PDC88]
MQNLCDQVTRYLSILNVPLQKPSYKYLEQICLAHLNAFPFENVSKLLYYHQNKDRNIRCQLYQTDQKRSVSLVNNKFSVQYSNGETEIKYLRSSQQWMRNFGCPNCL